MTIKNIKIKKGFTLIEILIAGFIISVGVIASSVVVQQIFADTFVASSNLTAAYLAKEGVEIVRNIRDTNLINGEDYDEGLEECNIDEGFYCEAEYNDADLASRSSGLDPSPVELANGSDSRFQRKIDIKDEVDFLRVIVTVLWQEKGQGKSLTIETALYDWY